jgi:NTP pyrophosphatase (non-canonical NTP hydrolase)
MLKPRLASPRKNVSTIVKKQVGDRGEIASKNTSRSTGKIPPKKSNRAKLDIAAPNPLTLSEYQLAVEKTDEKKRSMVSLLGLISEIGDLQSVFKKALINNRYPTFKKEITEELGDILWYLSSLATRHQLSLEDIARVNILKASQLFDNGVDNNFDADYPEDERLPRQFSVVFTEKIIDNSVQIKVQINGIFIGDGLDDNAHVDDGYRYHDIFHFAYATILGWSPVVRALLRRKRKSRSDIDRIEDGARAIFLEEAIAVFVFNQANERGHYKELNSISMDLLKTIKKLSENLEVNRCTAKQWQNAIFKGYEMFHLLKENHGGTITLDLDAKSLTFKAPIKAQKKGAK